jgi:hypothetical protein
VPIGALTVKLTLPDAAGFRLPRFQVTMPAEKVPPPVAETKVVPVGSASVMTALSAMPSPVFA